MIITIPTYGRVDKQTTYENLPLSLRERVIFVVQDRELAAWMGKPRLPLRHHVISLPPHITTIGPTRQWMIENLNSIDHKQVQLDDDLSFAVRRTDEPDKFVAATHKDIEDLFEEIERRLNNYAQVGVGHREGGNYAVEPVLSNTRITRMFGLRTDVLRAEGIRFDRLPCKVDFDLTLQLLRRGYDNIVLNQWVHNQSGSNKEGGCSHFRTHEVLEFAAHRLAELHVPFVQVVKKQTKSAWGGGERTDVRIQWKQARRAAGHTRLLDQRERTHPDLERFGDPEAME